MNSVIIKLQMDGKREYTDSLGYYKEWFARTSPERRTSGAGGRFRCHGFAWVRFECFSILSGLCEQVGCHRQAIRQNKRFENL